MVGLYINLKKIQKLIGRKNFYFFILIIIFNFILSLLEFLGISIIPVYFSLIFQNKSTIDDLIFFSEIKKFLTSFVFINQNILNISLFLIFYFFLKTVIMFAIMSSQSLVFKKIKTDLFKKLSSKYLKKNYKFFLSMNTSKIINHLSTELTTFNEAMNDIIIIFKELCLLATLVICFIFLDMVFFIALSFLILVFIFFYYSFKDLGYEGKKVIEKRSLLQKTLVENFSLIALIKQFRIENFIVNTFHTKIKDIEKINTKAEVLSNIPKVIYEFFAVTFIIIAILFLYDHLGDIDKVLTKIVILVIFLIRLVPSFKTLNKSFYQLRFKKAVIDEFIEVIEEKDINSNKNQFKNLVVNKIKFENVNFGYNKKDLILEKINFNIIKGDFIGLIGSSGSGKTSLINILSGLLSIQSGKIFINGKFFKNYQDILLENSSLTTQSTFLVDDTIKKNILLDLYSLNIDEKKILLYEKVLKDLNLDKMLEKFYDYDNTIVGENGKKLSGGQRQRVALARSLVRDKQIIVLDETFSGLDLDNEREILKALKNKYNNKIIILISHQRKSLKYCNKIFEVTNKKIRKIR
jgi:ABC-type multidrug transport system fused ATPase/permease subunit